MAILLQVVLVGLALCALVMCARMIFVRRRPVTRSPISGAVSWDSSFAGDDRQSAVPEPTVSSDGSVSDYRVRPGGSLAGSHWNPYAEEQSRNHRVQAARRKPRPQRIGHDPRYVSLDSSGVLDHYTLLGVRPEATAQEIEQAFRRYAAEIHPDKFFDDRRRRTEAEEKLKQLNAIMQVLRDPARRAAYDSSR